MPVQYRGFAFRRRRPEDRFPAIATDSDLIRDSILQILGTTRTERIMRPDFGSNVYRFVFANNDDFLADLITTEVRTAIGRYEPRVIVQNILSQRVDSEITITIEYIIRSTGEKQQVDVSERLPR